MAVYKVPQDVEADDKLIGPFSFRQFIYLIIVVAAGGIGYFLAQLFLPLFVVVLPIVLLFGALALPLRKDQPMETYLAAIISFYLKPRRRLWSPDGTQAFVQITVPNVVEVQRVKDISQEEAEQRLSYLASIVDSRGWAVRGVPGQTTSNLTEAAFNEAQSAPDILDDTAGVGQAFENKLDQADAKRHQDMLDKLRTGATQPVPQTGPQQTYSIPTSQIPNPYSNLQPAAAPAPQPQAQQAAPVDDQNIHVSYNPYPNMHQSVISPLGSTPQKASQATPQPESEKPSEKPVSPDIINLANNPDLSVETIAREANRIHEKEKLSEDEVVISLR